MILRPPLLLLALSGLLSGCASEANWPKLVPIGPLLAQTDAVEAQAPTGDLDARAAHLRARAESLRGPVLSAPVIPAR